MTNTVKSAYKVGKNLHVIPILFMSLVLCPRLRLSGPGLAVIETRPSLKAIGVKSRSSQMKAERPKDGNEERITPSQTLCNKQTTWILNLVSRQDRILGSECQRQVRITVNPRRVQVSLDGWDRTTQVSCVKKCKKRLHPCSPDTRR